MERVNEFINSFFNDGEFFRNTINDAEKLFEELDNVAQQVEKELAAYKRNGNLPPEAVKISRLSNSSLKENELTDIINTTDVKIKGKSKKHILKESSNESNTEPSIITDSIVKEIKKEKVSLASSDATLSLNTNVKVKSEIEEMPAPTAIPPRKKKIKTEPEPTTRSTRTKTRGAAKKNIEEIVEKPRKDSDVQLADTTVTIIEVDDSEENEPTKEGKKSNVALKSDQESDVESTRSTRTKTRQNKKNNVPVNDNVDNKETELDSQETTRTTRTKTRGKKNTKRTRNQSTDDEGVVKKSEIKKSRSNPKDNLDHNTTAQTEYEDAISDATHVVAPNANATYIASSPPKKKSDPPHPVLNATVVVEKPKYVSNNNNLNNGDLLTDDESEEEVTKASKPIAKTQNKASNKPLFSPFANSPVKKKVEAFEKFGAESSSIPTRITRTKRKGQNKDQAEPPEKIKETEEPPTNIVKEKTKAFTPASMKFIPKVCSTSRVNKYPGHNTSMASNDSLMSAKSASALKSSLAEFREREKRRREKEDEALKKREALLQAQTEEKRKKREEKQLKAQQQREALEKEKQKQLEVQKIKEERHKQLVAQREEKLQKQKEEIEKKRLLAKKKANEMKEREEEIRNEEKKMNEVNEMISKQNEKMLQLVDKTKERKLPMYMLTKPPLLPTDDCYDSDDAEYGQMKPRIPSWATDSALRISQLAMNTAGETIKNTFFCCQAQTPDLQEIFEYIDPRKLKRTSSAVWRKPPRYTLMPTLDQHSEGSEDSS